MTTVANPIFIYESKTKEYKIEVVRQVFDTHHTITNKNCLAKYYDHEDDAIIDTITGRSPFNTYKLMYPVYSMKIEYYTYPHSILYSTEIVCLKYNGALFSIMNRIRDAKFVEYRYYQGGSKKSNKSRIIRRRSNDSNPFRNKGVLNRLEYENGSGGVFYILNGDVKAFLRFCPKYELRRAMSIIRHDYYKLVGQYR